MLLRRETILELMSVSEKSSNIVATESPKPSTKLGLESLADAVIEGAQKYGGKDDLFIKDFPQYDRRISRVYTPRKKQ